MPIVNGPFRDPEDDNPPRRRKTPRALARLRRSFTYERKRADFIETFHREPASDDELETFFDEYTRELYNSGRDEVS
jgi:hypothetical protein